MTKPKIKFKLIKMEKALVFQVLEQDERFRCSGDWKSFRAANGFDVCSRDFPDWGLETGLLVLRGKSTSRDSKVLVETFCDNAERDAVHRRILAALRDWAANAPQFAEEKATTGATEVDTYQF